MPALNPVRAENLNPDVLVMQPAKQGVRHGLDDLRSRAFTLLSPTSTGHA
jgi:hypothetical protein